MQSDTGTPTLKNIPVYPKLLSQNHLIKNQIERARVRYQFCFRLAPFAIRKPNETLQKVKNS